MGNLEKSRKCIWTFDYKNFGKKQRTIGFSALKFDLTRNRLIASCTDDSIYALRFQNNNLDDVVLDAIFTGHKNSDYYNRIDISGDFIISGSNAKDTFQAYIWSLNTGTAVNSKKFPELKPIITLSEGHSDQIRCVKFLDQNWSPNNVIDGHSIVTAADDGCVRLWKPDLFNEIKHPDCVVDFDANFLIEKRTDSFNTNHDDVTDNPFLKSRYKIKTKIESKEITIEMSINKQTCISENLPNRITEQNKFSQKSTPMKHKKLEEERKILLSSKKKISDFFTVKTTSKHNKILQESSIISNNTTNRSVITKSQSKKNCTATIPKKRKDKEDKLEITPVFENCSILEGSLSDEDDFWQKQPSPKRIRR